MKKKPNYLKGLIIVHGKSELQMARYITSNLHLNMEIYGKRNGKNSIQIQGLLNELQSGDFKTRRGFLRKYIVEAANDELLNFKVFTIMDLDDCPESLKKRYLNKQMFEQHWMHPYIHPILNEPDLEHVLVDSGIIEEVKEEYVSMREP